jgi:hypothetical protein
MLVIVVVLGGLGLRLRQRSRQKLAKKEKQDHTIRLTHVAWLLAAYFGTDASMDRNTDPEVAASKVMKVLKGIPITDAGYLRDIAERHRLDKRLPAVLRGDSEEFSLRSQAIGAVCRYLESHQAAMPAA